MTGEREKKKKPADSPEVRTRVEEAIDLVRIAAMKICKHTGASLVRRDDFESMGREGLLEAARTYAPEHGIPFRNWAYLKIRGAIFDGMRKQGRLPRNVYARLRALEAANLVRKGSVEDESAAASETAESADQRIASAASSMAMAMAAGFLAPHREVPETLADENAVSPETATMKKQLLDRIKAAIDRRPDAERDLLTKMYFGGLAMDEAAKELGLSKSWGSRLHARALEAVAVDVRALTASKKEE